MTHMSEHPKPDEVTELLDALGAWVDELMKTHGAVPELREARERAAHSAKQSVEIALRRALHAGVGVSPVPTMTPRKTDSTDRLPAAAKLSSTHPHPHPTLPPPLLPPGATPAGGYALRQGNIVALAAPESLDAPASPAAGASFNAPKCPGPECPMCSGESCNMCGAGCWDMSMRDCQHDTAERHMRPSSHAAKKGFPPRNEPGHEQPESIDLMRGDDEDEEDV